MELAFTTFNWKSFYVILQLFQNVHTHHKPRLDVSFLDPNLWLTDKTCQFFDWTQFFSIGIDDVNVSLAVRFSTVKDFDVFEWVVVVFVDFTTLILKNASSLSCKKNFKQC